MNFFSRYIAYLRDNPKRYWFKRKLYGWGWTPATWQGWLSLAVMLAIFVWMLVSYAHTAPQRDISGFVVRVLLWAAALIVLCYFTGEPPRWQWGIPDKEEEKELAK